MTLSSLARKDAGQRSVSHLEVALPHNCGRRTDRQTDRRTVSNVKTVVFLSLLMSGPNY